MSVGALPATHALSSHATYHAHDPHAIVPRYAIRSGGRVS